MESLKVIQCQNKGTENRAMISYKFEMEALRVTREVNTRDEKQKSMQRMKQKEREISSKRVKIQVQNKQKQKEIIEKRLKNWNK